jgi:predicted nucleotidyltransferase
MQSLVRKESYGSVKIFWLEREKALELIEKAACVLGGLHPEILGIGVFGSLSRGQAVPGSDADVIIVLSESEKRMIDRSDDYIGYFNEIGMGVDLFCYSKAETESIGFAINACSEAIWLFKRRMD